MAFIRAIAFCVTFMLVSAYPQFSGNPFLQNQNPQQQNGQFFPNQGFPGQNFGNQGFPGQGFPGQGFPGQGFPNQQFGNQGFPNQGFGSQGFPNQFPSQGFQSFPGQGFPGQGSQNGQANQFRPNPNNPFLPVTPSQNQPGQNQQNQQQLGQNQPPRGQNQQQFGQNQQQPTNQNQQQPTGQNQQQPTGQNQQQFGLNQQQPGQNQQQQQQFGQNQQQLNGQLPTSQTPTASTTPPAVPAQSPAFLACVRNCQTTNEYNPVCGTDQNAYGNIRRLECANRCGQQLDPNWQEIRVFREGACTSGQRVP